MVIFRKSVESWPICAFSATTWTQGPCDPMIWRIGGSKRSDRQRRSPRAGASSNARDVFCWGSCYLQKKFVGSPPRILFFFFYGLALHFGRLISNLFWLSLLGPIKLPDTLLVILTWCSHYVFRAWDAWCLWTFLSQSHPFLRMGILENHSK